MFLRRLLLLAAAVLLAAMPVRAQKPKVFIEKEEHDGVTRLTFRFVDVPKTFHLDQVQLMPTLVRPIGPVQGHPAQQIKAVSYTARVSTRNLTEKQPILAKLRLQNDPTEAYALASICLWLDRRNSRAEFDVVPVYLDAKGQPIALQQKEASIRVVLENRTSLVAAQGDECK
jgi:hypothetical protein